MLNSVARAITRDRTLPGQLAQRTVALILAGGNGTRLGDLTRWDAKPAVSFGGTHRNIDFSLSNCINSGIRRVAVMTQYKAQSLIEHVQQGWDFLPRQLGEFIDLWPAQQRINSGWYRGTADAIHQNLDLLRKFEAPYVLVLAGDHIYTMDYSAMLEAHVRCGAKVTIGCVEMPRETVGNFGVVIADENGKITNFLEKPREPERLFPDCEQLLVSMGIYVFSTDYLIQALERDASLEESTHDFGRDVLPRATAERCAHAYSFKDRKTGQPGYWRDVGTLDAYWLAHMELLSHQPPISLDDPSWPIHTRQQHLPPASIVQRAQRGGSLIGNVILSQGCVVTDAVVSNSVLAPGARVEARAIVEDSIILPGAIIGPGCHISRAIIDAGVQVPAGTVVGRDRNNDETRFTVTADHITLVSHAAHFGSSLGAQSAASQGVAA